MSAFATASSASATADNANTDFVTRQLAETPNTQLRLLEERAVRVHGLFASAGADYDSRVRQMEALLQRLRVLKARVLPTRWTARLTNRNAEAAEVQAIATAIDEIVAA